MWRIGYLLDDDGAIHLLPYEYSNRPVALDMIKHLDANSTLQHFLIAPIS